MIIIHLPAGAALMAGINTLTGTVSATVANSRGWYLAASARDSNAKDGQSTSRNSLKLIGEAELRQVYGRGRP
jgi:hypothetical protein